MEWRTIFPHRLMQRREQRGLSKVALGKMVGVTHVSIREFETGRKVPSVDTLIALARALDCSVDWLCGLTNEPDLPSRHE
jgi:transcriptional regulator with XRE-family HTH domain